MIPYQEVVESKYGGISQHSAVIALDRGSLTFAAAQLQHAQVHEPKKQLAQSQKVNELILDFAHAETPNQ